MEKIGLVFSEEFDHPLIAEGHSMRRQLLYRISRSAWEAGPTAGLTGGNLRRLCRESLAPDDLGCDEPSRPGTQASPRGEKLTPL